MLVLGDDDRGYVVVEHQLDHAFNRRVGTSGDHAITCQRRRCDRTARPDASLARPRCGIRAARNGRSADLRIRRNSTWRSRNRFGRGDNILDVGSIKMKEVRGTTLLLAANLLHFDGPVEVEARACRPCRRKNFVRTQSKFTHSILPE